jgi:hypothetical protein
MGIVVKEIDYVGKMGGKNCTNQKDLTVMNQRKNKRMHFAIK